MTLIKTTATAPGQDPVHIEMSSDEEAAFEAERTSALSVQQTKDLIYRALKALDITDMVALRCFKAGIPLPVRWQVYTAALRLIVNGAQIDFPSQPTFPEGS